MDLYGHKITIQMINLLFSIHNLYVWKSWNIFHRTLAAHDCWEGRCIFVKSFVPVSGCRLKVVVTNTGDKL